MEDVSILIHVLRIDEADKANENENYRPSYPWPKAALIAIGDIIVSIKIFTILFSLFVAISTYYLVFGLNKNSSIFGRISITVGQKFDAGSDKTFYSGAMVLPRHDGSPADYVITFVSDEPNLDKSVVISTLLDSSEFLVDASEETILNLDKQKSMFGKLLPSNSADLTYVTYHGRLPQEQLSVSFPKLYAVTYHILDNMDDNFFVSFNESYRSFPIYSVLELGDSYLYYTNGVKCIDQGRIQYYGPEEASVSDRPCQTKVILAEARLPNFRLLRNLNKNELLRTQIPLNSFFISSIILILIFYAAVFSYVIRASILGRTSPDVWIIRVPWKYPATCALTIAAFFAAYFGGELG